MRDSDHDVFHPPTSDDPWWQETAWFTFVVPERRLTCYVYPWVKPNQGILGGGVMVWDDRGRDPWDVVHWDYQWTYPYPTPGDLRDITFPTGISMRCVEPMQTYRVTYEHPRCSIDVTFEAILPAHVLGPEDDTSGTFSGHVDQQGHVTGTITIDGERIDVDCFAMRDRSWGPRVPTPGLHIGYDLCAEAAVRVRGVLATGRSGGAHRRELRLPLARRRAVAVAFGEPGARRDGVWPRRVVVRAVDAAGRSFEAVGDVRNHMGFQNLPSMMNVVGLVRWEYEGSDGAATVGWGEFEDVWDVERYRRFARELVPESV